MKHPGQDPFERPMRPDRIAAIQGAIEEFVICEDGIALAKGSETFQNYQTCVAHMIYGALAETLPDTMIAELQEGLAGAVHLCTAIFKIKDELSCEDALAALPDNTAD